MKISFSPPGRRAQSGSAVMMVMIMLSIMVVCVAVNTVALRTLSQELKLLEKKQVQRLQNSSSRQPGAASLPDASPALPKTGTPPQHD